MSSSASASSASSNCPASRSISTARASTSSVGSLRARPRTARAPARDPPRDGAGRQRDRGIRQGHRAAHRQRAPRDHASIRHRVRPATWESDIIALGFWRQAFELLKESGAIVFATSGKLAGCWVMPAEGDEEDGDDDTKVLVKSDGIATYTAKDIAYQLWKFGLLGRDFHYRPWEGDASLDEHDERARARMRQRRISGTRAGDQRHRRAPGVSTARRPASAAPVTSRS